VRIYRKTLRQDAGHKNNGFRLSVIEFAKTSVFLKFNSEMAEKWAACNYRASLKCQSPTGAALIIQSEALTPLTSVKT
jgi:hypothetical protein